MNKKQLLNDLADVLEKHEANLDLELRHNPTYVDVRLMIGGVYLIFNTSGEDEDWMITGTEVRDINRRGVRAVERSKKSCVWRRVKRPDGYDDYVSCSDYWEEMPDDGRCIHCWKEIEVINE